MSEFVKVRNLGGTGLAVLAGPQEAAVKLVASDTSSEGGPGAGGPFPKCNYVGN